MIIIIEAESKIVNESIEDVEENQTERDIVRTSFFFFYMMIYINTNKLKNLQSPSASC